VGSPPPRLESGPRAWTRPGCDLKDQAIRGTTGIAASVLPHGAYSRIRQDASRNWRADAPSSADELPSVLLFYGTAAIGREALQQHAARIEVRADLALHPLERVVDGLRVARQPLGDR